MVLPIAKRGPADFPYLKTAQIVFFFLRGLRLDARQVVVLSFK
jgi:hypothetical protein